MPSISRGTWYVKARRIGTGKTASTYFGSGEVSAFGVDITGKKDTSLELFAERYCLSIYEDRDGRDGERLELLLSVPSGPIPNNKLDLNSTFSGLSALKSPYGRSVQAGREKGH